MWLIQGVILSPLLETHQLAKTHLVRASHSDGIGKNGISANQPGGNPFPGANNVPWGTPFPGGNNVPWGTPNNEGSNTPGIPPFPGGTNPLVT